MLAVVVAFVGSGSSEWQSRVVPWSVQVVHWVELYSRSHLCRVPCFVVAAGVLVEVLVEEPLTYTVLRPSSTRMSAGGLAQAW